MPNNQPLTNATTPRLSPSRIATKDGQFTLVENARETNWDVYRVVWTGLVYDHDSRVDDQAIEAILKDLKSGYDIESTAGRLRGAFFMAIQDHQQQTIYSLVDDSALFAAYRGPHSSSTSFILLCEMEGIHSDRFTRPELLELLNLGNVYFGDTLVEEVRKLSSEEIHIQSPSQSRCVPKQIPKIWDRPLEESIEAAAAPLAKALQGKSVALDLTGGFDSRMVACLMYGHDLQFEAGLSGDLENEDAILGAEVANALGVPFRFTEYDRSSVVEDLPALLERLDGMSGQLVVTHRLHQLNASRVQRGVDTLLKGGGGELYKEFFWTQDFPFYRSRVPKMARLNRLRIEHELLAQDQLTDTAFQDYQKLRSRRVRRLEEEYTRPLNTQSYDVVYFYERVQMRNSRLMANTSTPEIAVHAPLCELRLAQHGYHAPRSMRFFNRFHKKVISATAPAVAKILTTDGMSASSRPVDMLADSLGYTRAKAKKLARKLSQLLLNTTKFSPPAYSPDRKVLQRLAMTDLAQDSIQALKDRDILKPHVTLQDLSPRFQEHAIVTGWIIRRLKA